MGKPHWQYFIGSSIGSSIGNITILEDELTLVCSIYTGFISIIQLDIGKSKEYEIYNGKYTEIRCWLI